MKKAFSLKWRESKQPRKQRKYIHNLPLHLRQKQMSACLDKELRKKYGIRSLEVRKNDEVLIMRGKFKKRKGKVLDVDVKNQRITVENIQNKKKDGNKVNVWLHPSKVKIVIAVDDKERFNKTKKETIKNAQ